MGAEAAFKNYVNAVSHGRFSTTSRDKVQHIMMVCRLSLPPLKLPHSQEYNAAAKENVKTFIKGVLKEGFKVHLQMDLWQHKAYALMAVIVTGLPPSKCGFFVLFRSPGWSQKRICCRSGGRSY